MGDRRKARKRAAERARAERAAWAAARLQVVDLVEHGLQAALDHWPAEARSPHWHAAYREGAGLVAALETWATSGRLDGEGGG